MPIVNHHDLIPYIVKEELLKRVPMQLGIHTGDVAIVASSHSFRHREFGVVHCLLDLSYRVVDGVEGVNSSVHLPVGSVVVEVEVHDTAFIASSDQMLFVLILVSRVSFERELEELIGVGGVCRDCSDLLNLGRLPLHVCCCASAGRRYGFIKGGNQRT